MMEQWNFGMMGITVFYQLRSTKYDDPTFLNQYSIIPTFQHSVCKLVKAKENGNYLQLVVEFPRRFKLGEVL